MVKKRCTKCGKKKLQSEFSKNRTRKNNLYPRCKECRSEDRHIQYIVKYPDAKRVLSYTKSHRTIRGTNQKFCTGCDQWKLLDKFDKDKSKNDGLVSRCKNCRVIYNRTRKTENRKRQKKRRQTLNGYLQRLFGSVNQRCNNPNHTSYKNYGGRGIKNLFKSFDEFFVHITVDLKMNTYKKIKGLQIDRIDNDGHYEHGNIRFVTAKVNANNRRKR